MKYPLERWKTEQEWIGTDEPDPQTIAYVDEHRNRRRWTEDEKQAIVTLIAAAPDLLDALTRIHDMIFEDGSQPIGNCREIVNAAIAKAPPA